jgi:small subunit ribosomal protein S16
MPVKIRLQRHGRSKRPFYHIIVADSRNKRDGKFIERIGDYNPLTVPATINLDVDKAFKWVMDGAQPTNTAKKVLTFKGVLYKKHLQRGVTKGAFDQDEADKLYAEWVEAKMTKVQARLEKELQKIEEKRTKRNTEEATKRSAKLVAKAEAEAAVEAEAVAAEAAKLAEEAGVEEATETAPAEETTQEAPAEEATEEVPAVEAAPEETTEEAPAEDVAPEETPAEDVAPEETTETAEEEKTEE